MSKQTFINAFRAIGVDARYSGKHRTFFIRGDHKNPEIPDAAKAIISEILLDESMNIAWTTVLPDESPKKQYNNILEAIFDGMPFDGRPFNSRIEYISFMRTYPLLCQGPVR